MKKKAFPVLIVVALIILMVGVIIIAAVVKKYTPSKEHADLNEHYGITSEDSAAIIYNYEDRSETATLMDGQVYLDYNFVHDYIDERFYWDANENVLLYTTPTDVIMAYTDDTTYTVSRDSVDFSAVVVKATADSALVNVNFISIYSDMIYNYYENPNRVVITTDYEDISVATTKKATEIRELGGIKSPILVDLDKGVSLTIVMEDENWSCVMTEDGIIGYIKNDDLHNYTTETVSSGFAGYTYSHVFLDETVCLGWNYIGSSSANSNVSSVLNSSRGINVVAPTWFYLQGSDGSVGDKGSAEYVATCHQQGIEVWAMIDNLTDESSDSGYVFTHTSARQNLVNQLIALAIQYDLDGINLDFESLNPEIGDAYIQFIRELSIKCHNNGLVLSVDNYVPSSYTAFYNRSEQAVFADYVIIMGYDEHTSGSEEAGSVASINWVTEAVNNTLAEVPANQVVLGMPFYTRLWCLSPQAEGGESDSNVQYTLSSSALTMAEQESLVSSKNLEKVWDETYGQFYATYQENGNTYQIWLEDAESLEERLALMQSTNLGGCAFWRLGYETSNVWDTVAKYL